MPKIKISSKAINARVLAIYALDKWIEHVSKTEPELDASEATLLAAIILDNLPDLFEYPAHRERLQEGARRIIEKRNAQN